MNVCIDCGSDYKYDSSNALGASSIRCAKCRKRDTKKQKRISILMIAGNGVLQCRKCGYRSCSGALILVDGVSSIDQPTSREEKERRARAQFLLCLYCSAEINSSEVEFNVTDSKFYPIKVEFYAREVRIVKTKLEAVVNYNREFEDVEVTTDGAETERIVHEKKRFIEQSPIDVPAL